VRDTVRLLRGLKNLLKKEPVLDRVLSEVTEA